MNKVNINDWPYNVIEGIAEKEDLGIKEEILSSKDRVDGILYAISTLLPREQQIVYQRFRCGRTYVSIAKDYDISPTRVSGITENAIHKLNAPQRMVFVKNGYLGGQRVLAAEEAARKNANELAAQRIQNLVSVGADVPIEYLGFSTRVYNCLKRSGFNFLHDILSSRNKTLVSIQGLGWRSVEDFSKKMLELGFSHNNYGESYQELYRLV